MPKISKTVCPSEWIRNYPGILGNKIFCRVCARTVSVKLCLNFDIFFNCVIDFY
jgi:hypothetical protein